MYICEINNIENEKKKGYLGLVYSFLSVFERERESFIFIWVE